MKISYKTLLTKMTNPMPGTSLVKLTTNEDVQLWTPEKASKSAIIRLSNTMYLAHLQPGDILVQGSYVRSRKLFTVNDLEDIQTCTIKRLEKTNMFTQLYEVPNGMHRVRVDNSLGNISNNLLAALNGLDRLIGVNCHSEFRFDGKLIKLEKLPVNEDGWGKALRGVSHANVKSLTPGMFFTYNQLTGKLEVARFISSDSSASDVDAEQPLTKGVSIATKSGGNVLEIILDLKVLNFSEFFTKTLLQDKTA